MRQIYKTEGIVLRSLAYGESDLIMTFFTGEYGKLKGIAKGARRSKKRFVNALDLFSRSYIVFSRKSAEGLALIESCDVKEHYPGVREELERTLIATYLVDLVDQFSSEGKRDYALYRELNDFLELIGSGNGTDALVRIFELRLLRRAGYEPVLDRCLACKTEIQEIANPAFSSKEGGIFCEQCAAGKPGILPASRGTFRTLLLGRDMEPAKIGRIVFTGRSEVESRLILTAFIRHILGKELQSLRIMNDLRKLK